MSGLTIGTLTLTPPFDAETKSYTVSTGNSTNKVTATCDADATITIELSNTNGVSSMDNGTAATWATGENVLTVTVSAGGRQTAYTVTVTKT